MAAKAIESNMFLFRTALFVGLSSVVATIIYLTPIPEQFPQSCVRPCHELDWPMICRVKMVVENLPCVGPHCRHGLLTINRQTPGPPIQVCENDIIVVDVSNRVTGRSLTVHWRGQSLRETPHMDGVPMVTQCPILPHTTFQYKFRAAEAGTHFWKFNTDVDASEGLFGAFIVKQANTKEKFHSFYDTDDASHVVLIHTKESSIFVNGHDQGLGSQSAFNVTQGRRHRFRIIYAGRPNSCSLRIRVDDTPLTLIAVDGHSVAPVSAISLEISYGERLDVILQVKSADDNKHFHIESEPDCGSLRATASALVVTEDEKMSAGALQDAELSLQIRSTVFGDCGNDSSIICLSDIKGSDHLPEVLSEDKLDHKIFLFFGVRKLDIRSNASIILPVADGSWGAPHINNRTMLFPSSPLMSQPDDVDPKAFCQDPCTPEGTCECTHVLHVPLGETVEIILVDKGGGKRKHMFHLHGYSFYVVGTAEVQGHPSAEELMAMDAEGKLVKRNFTNPIKRDSIAIPERGAAALRFHASNPGYWLLEEEVSPGGMQVLLHVGEPSDLPATPKNFPRCGSWVGPEFFLA